MMFVIFSISCITNDICTLTGPMVIDVHGQVSSVEDRCTYSLLSFPTFQGLEVRANYQERRRRDVSFLDSITLVAYGSEIHLGQGGRVQVSCMQAQSSSQTEV